jgi:hypothetical protein
MECSGHCRGIDSSETLCNTRRRFLNKAVHSLFTFIEEGRMANETSKTPRQTPDSANQATRAAATSPTIKWDDSNLKSSYANVCNVSTTREEVVLIFGINNAWERGQKEVHVQLTDRLILSPFAAKRLATLLNNVMADYEKRFGTMSEPTA